MLALFQCIADALFPPQCAPCGKKLSRGTRFSTICDTCFARIPIRTGFSCAECGKRLPELKNTCHKGTPVIAAATDFQNEEVQALIYALKYHNILDAAIPLAHILHRYAAQHLPAAALPHLHIVPIPLHRARIMQRGFNQSERIARTFATLDNRAIIYTNNLARTRNTNSQTKESTYEKRKENVRGAFQATPLPIDTHEMLFALDDVCTSGGTITEAARALRVQGAKKIIGLVIARA